MNIFKTLFLGTCLLTACSQSNQLNDCTSIKINNTQYEKWSSFFNIEEIVPLEQTDKSLVTMASKCSVNDGMVFFSDFRLKSLFVFGLDGKFKFEVGKSFLRTFTIMERKRPSRFLMKGDWQSIIQIMVNLSSVKNCQTLNGWNSRNFWMLMMESAYCILRLASIPSANR